MSDTNKPVNRGGLSRQIVRGWRGQAKLSWAFWSFYFGGGLLLLFIAAIAFLFLMPFAYTEGVGVQDSPLFRAYLLVTGIIYFGYVVISTVMTWRCSWSVQWRPWGYIARAVLISWLVRIGLGVATLANIGN